MARFNRKPKRPAPDDRWPVPTTLGEAKAQIARTFADNRWDENEQSQYLQMCGFDLPLAALDRDQVRVVHSRMIEARMMLLKGIANQTRRK